MPSILYRIASHRITFHGFNPLTAGAAYIRVFILY